MKKIVFLLAIAISFKSFAQTDSSKKEAYPPLSQIYATNNLSQKQLNSYVGNYFDSYTNQARIGLLMEGGGVVLGFGGALLSANSVSATPINVSLIGGGIITLVGFLVRYDSYKFLKHAALLLKSKQ